MSLSFQPSVNKSYPEMYQILLATFVPHSIEPSFVLILLAFVLILPEILMITTVSKQMLLSASLCETILYRFNLIINKLQRISITYFCLISFKRLVI